MSGREGGEGRGKWSRTIRRRHAGEIEEAQEIEKRNRKAESGNESGAVDAVGFGSVVAHLVFENSAPPNGAFQDSCETRLFQTPRHSAALLPRL